MDSEILCYLQGEFIFIYRSGFSNLVQNTKRDRTNNHAKTNLYNLIFGIYRAFCDDKQIRLTLFSFSALHLSRFVSNSPFKIRTTLLKIKLSKT